MIITILIKFYKIEKIYIQQNIISSITAINISCLFSCSDNFLLRNITIINIKINKNKNMIRHVMLLYSSVLDEILFSA
jgi:hypothetical protein